MLQALISTPSFHARLPLALWPDLPIYAAVNVGARPGQIVGRLEDVGEGLRYVVDLLTSRGLERIECAACEVVALT